jgi:hypothetical protein
MLTMLRLLAADPSTVAYCPRCRTDLPDARTDPCEDDTAPLRCPKCADLLELAAVEVTDLDTSAVDFAQILEDVGLPRDAAQFHGVRCTHFTVIEDADVILH